MLNSHRKNDNIERDVLTIIFGRKNVHYGGNDRG